MAALKFVCIFVYNGSLTKVFHLGRGLRQEDPMPPYLFFLCMEGLSTLLNREEANRTFWGLRINRFCPFVSHLFFANDNLIFCRARR